MVSVTPAVELRGVIRSFPVGLAPQRVLRGLDLAVADGEFVAVIGTSGSGKSTLLHLVAGLDRPDEGSVKIGGEELTSRSEKELTRIRRRAIGLVFQFFHLLEGLSALENVVLPALAAGAPRRDAERRAVELLDLVGLAGKGAVDPSTLSGGQRQRLTLARALANHPTVLLADEPTGALDAEGATEIFGLFNHLHGGGQTILMVTHDATVAGAADRVVVLRDGRIDHA